MKQVLKILTLVLIVLFGANNISLAALKISPQMFEYTVDKKSRKNFITGSFIVQAGAGEVIRFKVYPEFFEISDRGDMETNLPPNNEFSMADDIRFNPREFTLTKDKDQRVRFTITNIKKFQDGEHRVALFLEDVKTKEKSLPTNKEGFSAKVILKTRVAIPIYLDKGDVIKRGQIENASITPKEDEYIYNVNLKSVGNSKIRVKGIGQIIGEQNNLIAEFPVAQEPIQAQITRKYTGKIPDIKMLDENEYKVNFVFKYCDENSKEQVLSKQMILKKKEKANSL